LGWGDIIVNGRCITPVEQEPAAHLLIKCDSIRPPLSKYIHAQSHLIHLVFVY